MGFTTVRSRRTLGHARAPANHRLARSNPQPGREAGSLAPYARSAALPPGRLTTAAAACRGWPRRPRRHPWKGLPALRTTLRYDLPRDGSVAGLDTDRRRGPSLGPAGHPDRPDRRVRVSHRARRHPDRDLVARRDLYALDVNGRVVNTASYAARPVRTPAPTRPRPGESAAPSTTSSAAETSSAR